MKDFFEYLDHTINPKHKCNMNHYQKEVQRGIDDDLFELSEKHCQHDDKKYNSCLWHIFKPFMEKFSNNLHRAFTKDMEELIKSKATLKTYFGDEYCSVDGFLEALKEKHYETHI